MEAAASVVGIASFGLGLAKSLQAFIDSVIEAEETVILTVADVNSTASTLKDLQDFIDQDKAASKEQHRATVFNTTSIKEISACALQCQKIYVQIIILIEKASMHVGEDGSKDTGPQAPAADDLNTPAARLAVFSKNVTRLGRKMRWPWLEPRIKRCQEHLGRLKASLMLRLLVVSIAESRARPSIAKVFGTNDENEIRDIFETLRKRMTEFRTKKDSPKNPQRHPSGSDGKIYARKRTERKAVFKEDLTSATFEAYLIYSYPADSASPPLTKLPFGHRRLTREEAKSKADKEDMEKGKAELEEARETLEAEKIRIEQERNALDSRNRALKHAEEAVLKGIEKGTAEQDLKKLFEEERKKTTEEVRPEEAAKKAAGDDKEPIKFKDAVGRKFNFPFNLISTWQGIEGLIKQAFINVDVIGPLVSEGHYDLLDSEGQVILPVVWDRTIKPGASVSMRMWEDVPRPPQPFPPFPGRPMQGVPPPPGMAPEMERMFSPMPRPVFIPPPPPPRRSARRSAMVDIVEGGRPRKDKTRRAKKTLSFFSGPKPSKKGGNDKHKYSKPKIVGPRDDDNSEEDLQRGPTIDIDEILDLDTELGLDDLEEVGQMAAKDIDQLLKTWTNIGGEM
ncbi:hypothetical protein INS49_009462 [Diaporthe citri]|uniref:uncharacterized protein n=1 Tax=Diaporthe citri TaxID=83186 RepID=UPI001C8043DC|nr:uncharacterized protein INS49_009462 [Diaporthe citri]KAG6361238.1 hypothetical protein INS49_009462 [Diaporthe citri]